MNFVKRFLAGALFIIAFFLFPFCLFSAPTPTPTIGPGFVYQNFETNGTIYALTRTANALYIGGSFSKVGLRTGALILLDTTGKQVSNPPFPQVNGTIYAIEPDTTGGAYIGGSFGYVAGLPCNNIAHILSDGSLDPNWTASTDSTVRAIAYNPAITPKVFVGGNFANATGSGGNLTARSDLAAFDPSTGALLGFNPGADGVVYSIRVDAASAVLIGGAFSVIGGVTTPYFAVVDPTTDPGINSGLNYGLNGNVNDIALGLGQFFIAGSFTLVNGSTVRNRMAVYSSYTSVTPSIQDFNCDNTVNAMCINTGTSTLYATGGFLNVNGTTARKYAAAFSTLSGTVTAWNPNLNAVGSAIATSGTVVCIGGKFTTAGLLSLSRKYAADFDLNSGTVNTWAPNPDGFVYAVKNIASSTVTNTAIGGSFRGYQCLDRNNLAAVNLSTGAGYAWNPAPDNTVYALALSGSTVYAGGIFANVNTTTSSLARAYLAAFSDYTTAGTAAAWNPSANSTVLALFPVGSAIYIGGAFTSMGGSVVSMRNYAAATDLVSGNVLQWNPNLNTYVRTFATDGTYIYAGGDFTTTSGGTFTRNYAAAFDQVTGTTQAWNPNLNGSVYSLATSQGNIYLGGTFTTVLGTTRNRVASISTAGTLNSMDPDANSAVYSLQVDNDALLIGGAFSTLGSSTRNYFGAYDINNQVLSAWNPNSGSTVDAITGNDNLISFGGYMTLLSQLPHGYGGVIECPVEAYTLTATITPTATFTRTFTPSATRTFTVTFTQTYTPTVTITATNTPTLTCTLSATLTASPSKTPSITPTWSITQTATTILISATITPTSSISPTFTGTPTFTFTLTGTDAYTYTPTETYSHTKTITPTYTSTYTWTVTQTATGTDSLTQTPSQTFTVTNTFTSIPTATPTLTLTVCAAGTFGNNSGSSVMISGGSSLYASRFQLLQDSTILQLNVYVSSGSGMIMAAIYSDNSDAPDSLIVPSAPITCSPGWNVVSIPVMPLSAGFYWLAVEAQTGIGVYYTDSLPGEGAVIANTFGTLPDPFGSGYSQQSREWSIYANFCPNSGYLITATITPTITQTWTVSPTYTVTPIESPTPTYTTTPTPVASLDIPANDDSYVYPMPASSSISFVFSLNETASVTINIFDFAGNLVKTVSGSNVAASNIAEITGVNISRFSRGVYYYLIKAVTASGKEIKYKINKFIVQK
jgi:hypothetical protein